MTLTLYKLDSSPPARAVMMTIEALKIPDVKYIDVNVREKEQMTEAYLKMNPQHTIPVLKDDDFVIWDSHAIAVYLITKYGQNDSLYPTDPRKRAVVDQRLYFDSGTLFTALRAAWLPISYGGEKVVRPENVEQIHKAYDFTEKFLTANWLAGNDVTVADICCVATISTLNVLVPIDSNTYPNIAAWFKRCSQQEFYKRGNETALLQFKAVAKSKME